MPLPDADTVSLDVKEGMNQSSTGYDSNTGSEIC